MVPERDDVLLAIGDLRGRVKNLEERANRDSAELKQALSDLTQKLESVAASMSKAIEALKLAQAQQLGSKGTLGFLFTGSVALGGLIIAALRFFFP